MEFTIALSWTRKEAFIKAKSQGLSFPLNSFSITTDKETTSILYETQWNPNEKKYWRIIPFNTHKDYTAAVAIKGQANVIQKFNCNDFTTILKSYQIS